jgi:hypothetical protein
LWLPIKIVKKTIFFLKAEPRKTGCFGLSQAFDLSIPGFLVLLFLKQPLFLIKSIYFYSSKKLPGFFWLKPGFFMAFNEMFLVWAIFFLVRIVKGSVQKPSNMY